MQNGTYITNCAPFGYSLISSSELAIVPNEAKIVKNIYDLYLSGIGQREIVRILNAEQIPYRNGQQWTYSKVKAVLSNEKYYGDSILQKKYTVDALSHYRQRNNGQRQQYYVQGSQPAIIPKDKYDKVRALAAIRKNNQATRHLFTHRIICPDCNRHYREVNANRKSYWLCPYKANGLSPCKAPRISESNITQAAINMMVKLYLHQDNILSPTIAHLREIEYTQTGNDSKLYELDKSIADLNDKVLMLQKLNSKGFISADEYRLRSEKLSVERQKLTAARNKKLNGLQSHSAIEKLEELQAILAAWPGIPTEFDIEQFDEIVEKIIPTENNALIFRLHCGLELTEAIPE